MVPFYRRLYFVSKMKESDIKSIATKLDCLTGQEGGLDFIVLHNNITEEHVATQISPYAIDHVSICYTPTKDDVMTYLGKIGALRNGKTELYPGTTSFQNDADYATLTVKQDAREVFVSARSLALAQAIFLSWLDGAIPSPEIYR